MLCRVLTSIPDLYPPRYQYQPSFPVVMTRNCLHMWPHVPPGDSSPSLRSIGLRGGLGVLFFRETFGAETQWKVSSRRHS